MIRTHGKPMIIFSLVFLYFFVFMHNSASAYDIEGISIHGFLSQGYITSSDNTYLTDSKDGSYEFTESGINFSIEPIEKLRLGLQLFSRDLGDEGNNEVVLDWGFGDYHWKDYLGLRAGKIKLPFGFYNQTRDVDFLRSSILLPQGIYSENMREILVSYQGGSIYGNILLGGFGNCDYELFTGTSNLDNSSPFVVDFVGTFASAVAAALSISPVVTNIDASFDETIGGAIRWNTSIDGLRFGVTNFVADIEATSTLSAATFIMDIQVKEYSVLSAEYIWNKLMINAEYGRREYDVGLKYGGADLPTVNLKQEGFYAGMSYQFCDRFQLGTYYSVFYPNKEDKNGDDLEALGLPDYMAWQKDWAVSARVDANEHVVLKLEAHFIDGTGLLFTHLNPPAKMEKNWEMFVAKVSFNF
jgi:hypothetical protein